MSKQWRWPLYALIALSVVLSGWGVHAAPTAQAQGALPWLEVWYFPNDDLGPPIIEYRDAVGTVLASYPLATDNFSEVFQGGGNIATRDGNDFLGVFNPHVGVLRYFTVTDKPQDTDTEFYVLSRPIPTPNGWLTYSISRMDTQGEQPAFNSIYYADPSYERISSIYDAESAEPWFGIEPLGWTDDGSMLLLHNAPTGIGGYILFWTYLGVEAHPLTDMQQSIPLGDLDGYAGDLSMTAQVVRDADYVVQGIQVTVVASGDTMTYPLPPLGEPVHAGGNAHFSPSHTRLAYQVARENPEDEKFWTVVVDLTTGQSRVVYEQTFTQEDWDFGYISGWLDDSTLVVGSQWQGRSVLVNVDSGALTEAPGVFLGYAQGVNEVGGFAPAGMVYVQCDDAPISRLAPGVRGRVVADSVTLQSWTSYDADVTGQEPAGATFTAQHGPFCGSGTLWWDVLFDDGQQGYVIESNYQGYFLEPAQ